MHCVLPSRIIGNRQAHNCQLPTAMDNGIETSSSSKPQAFSRPTQLIAIVPFTSYHVQLGTTLQRTAPLLAATNLILIVFLGHKFKFQNVLLLSSFRFWLWFLVWWMRCACNDWCEMSRCYFFVATFIASIQAISICSLWGCKNAVAGVAVTPRQWIHEMGQGQYRLFLRECLDLGRTQSMTALSFPMGCDYSANVNFECHSTTFDTGRRWRLPSTWFILALYGRSHSPCLPVKDGLSDCCRQFFGKR